jgi:hypothetical protein
MMFTDRPVVARKESTDRAVFSAKDTPSGRSNIKPGPGSDMNLMGS